MSKPVVGKEQRSGLALDITPDLGQASDMSEDRTQTKNKYKHAAEKLRKYQPYAERTVEQELDLAIDLLERMAKGELVERALLEETQKLSAERAETIAELQSELTTAQEVVAEREAELWTAEQVGVNEGWFYVEECKYYKGEDEAP